MKATVVGAGINGCATAWALRKRGADVTLVDQFAPGHTHGSSHGRTRIFRLAYPERHWVELAEEALAGWRELEQETGTTLLELHGLVELCSSVGVSSRDVLEARGIEHRLLERSELDVALPEGWIALWQRDAGIVRADLALDAFRGDLPVEQRRVESLDDVDGDVVVVTAGAWAPQLLPGLPVRVTRETVAYFAYDGVPLPSVVELDEATRRHAMYVLHDPLYGLKAGAHHSGPVADPDVASPPERIGSTSGSRTSTRSRSARRRASTRRPPTSRSSSSAAAGSSSGPPAPGMRSSSRPLLASDSRSWRSGSKESLPGT